MAGAAVRSTDSHDVRGLLPISNSNRLARGVLHEYVRAPASDVMSEIEKTILVFTIVSAPLMAITLTIIVYSLVGWGRVTGDEPPMQESPAIRSNATGTYLWIGATSLLAAFLVIWGLLALANITASSYGSIPSNQQPNAAKAIDINVTGQQWVWTFEYPDQGKISSDVLVVPIDTPIYFNVTSVDVIHSFGWLNLVSRSMPTPVQSRTPE